MANGVDQTPWLDDDASGTYTGGDGAVATARYLSTNFGTVPPTIDTAILTRDGVTGTVSAAVLAGDANVKSVWAAVFAPSYTPPTTTTLSLGVPMVQLTANGEGPGVFTGSYGGFTEAGNYRVVVYAVDDSDNEAMPKVAFYGSNKVFLPLVIRAQ